MAGIFISYRRSDTAPHAARLRERLGAQFGDEYVFMDVDSLRPGEPFPLAIESTITGSDAVLALIGADWLTITDGSGRRRLEDPGDFVRIELETAFRCDRIVIPVLLEHAAIPGARELPPTLSALHERHAIDVRDENWEEDVARLVYRLEEVVDTIPPCPYPGMVPFRRTDADRFFGREREVADIDARLAADRLLCLVGPSGCGKSSLLEAGVLAHLESARPGDWSIRTMRPGSAPSRRLDAVLADQPGAGRPLLVVDQLEELFTQAGADEQARFVASLSALHGDGRTAILLAVRADFYGELMESTLWPLVERARVDVVPIAGDALAAAMTQPATHRHVVLEPDLVERLLADAGREPGALPLLQETLVRLWSTMRLHRISLAAYGGLSAAVADTADTAMAELPPARLPIARRVLLRLVQFGEGRPDTRRQLRVAELRSEGDDDRLLEAVLDHLGRFRLLTLTEGRVDLAHEALITGWPTLGGWVAQRRGAELARRRLVAHVDTWEGHGRAAALLDDVQLREAQAWLASADARELGVPPGLPELVARSDAALVRRRRLRTAAVSGLACLLAVAAVLAVVFLRARNDAVHKANVAQSRELAARAAAALGVDPHRSLRLALGAVDVLARDGSATGADRREAQAELRDAIRASRVRAVFDDHRRQVVAASFDPSGDRVVSASWDGTARVWDARTGAARAVLGRPGGKHLETAAFSPDGRRVVTAGTDGTARLWDAASGRALAVLRHKPGSGVTSAVFDPAGARILTAGTDGTARLWNARTGAAGAVLREPGEQLHGADFSPDGKLVVTAGAPGLAEVWRVADRTLVARLPHAPPAVNTARFSSDGRSIVTSSDDRLARVWRVEGGRPVVLRGHDREVVDAEFSPDGRSVVTAGLDDTAREWNARTGAELRRLTHDDTVRTATFSPDGTRVATASADHTARVWDAGSGEELIALRGHGDYVGTAAFSPDGKRVVTSSFDRTARVWDVSESDPLRTVGGRTVAAAALSPDGTRVATASSDGRPRIWDARTGAPVSTLGHSGAPLTTLVFASDGRHVVTVDEDGVVATWSASSGDLERSERPGGGASWGLKGFPFGTAFSADGTRAVTFTDADDVGVFGLIPARRLSVLHVPGGVESAALSADGTRVAIAASDETARVYDVASRKPLHVFKHDGAVVSAAFSAHGDRLLTASADTTARLWDTHTGAQLTAFRGHKGELLAASLSRDGRWVATAGADQSARIWDADTGQEIALFEHPAAVLNTAFDRSGHRVLTLSDDQRARVFACELCVGLNGLVRLGRERVVAGLR